MSVSIVDEDGTGEVATALQQGLSFQVKVHSQLDEALEEMNKRETEMVIQIPSHFMTTLQEGKQPFIYYWINQASPIFSKSIMEQAANQVTNELNANVFAKQTASGAAVFIQQLQQLRLDLPTEQAIAGAIQSQLSALETDPVKKIIKKPNEASEFSANLVPLMVIISSFVGAMVMIMQIHEASSFLRTAHSKWSLFLGRQLINVTVAFLLPLLTIGLMRLFSVEIEEPLYLVYLFQGVMFLTFLLFAQVFVYLFGNYGMAFNILALSLQLVTSGVLISRDLLSSGYRTLSAFLPATYGADGMLLQKMTSLAWIASVALIIAAGAVVAGRESYFVKAIRQKNIIEN
ncbi:YhgE/Pip domain-containing protein [Bacillus sp. OxB-1]|uniref:YhgE/Pip domain-containing protein n=1 Tax=Bacillus sp. (strain OxB-1) TaxID=98228 RepID=UPI000697D9C4|nr:ABC transporter permease [Bacillus sp. OxB-1]